MAELDDDRKGIEPETSEEGAGDAAVAFDALRRTIETQGAQIGAEMTVMRRGLEAAFDQLDKIEPAQDYKPQLARLVQAIDSVAARLIGVEQSPVLRQGAEHYARVIERSGEGLVRAAVLQLERQATDLERAGRNLAAHTKSAYDRKDQDFRMWTAGLAGLSIGIFLILLLPRFLPFSADSRVAALVMGGDRIDAAYAMIESVDPLAFKRMKWGAGFYEASGGQFSACFDKAKQTGKDQKCTVTVPVPE